jgi:hypothetical protein
LKNSNKLPNTACTGRWGFCAIYKHFSDFEFSLLPNRIHARPSASNANRSAFHSKGLEINVTEINGKTTVDLSWLCPVAIMVLMIPIIYYRTRSRMKYAKQLLKGISVFGNSKPMKFKTGFTRLDEFYKAVNALIERLKKEGHLKDSENLSTAMIAGSTGSEILGDIMLALKSMKGNYSLELKKEINECFEFAFHYRKILGLDGGR